MAVADLGEVPGEPAPPPLLFLDQTEAWRAEKFFFETTPSTPLSQGLDDRASPHLRVWIRHCMWHFS